MKFIFIILLLDLLFINFFMKNRFAPMVKNIQKEDLKLNYTYAFMAYLVIIALFYYFVVLKKATIKEAFLLGFLSYALFDFTNLAIFNQYELNTAIIDMIWGGSLFAITASLI